MGSRNRTQRPDPICRGAIAAATGADIKVMQELLRHASSRVTMDTYTQALTVQKRKAQSVVVQLSHSHAAAGD